MTREEYLVLFEKYLSGNASDEEEEELLQYKDGLNINDFHNTEEIDDQQAIQKRIFNKIEDTRHKPVKKLIPKLWWAAAAVLLIVSAGLFVLNSHKSDQPPNNIAAHALKPIVPGGNKAILTLANGAVINLNAASNGVIARSGDVAITKEKNGQLVYAAEADQSDKDDKISYNTISIPRGGQYQLILPDGTNVWLNSASSLKYPVKFKGMERHVELTGEAYFEVAKNKNMPFTINANNVNIKVLGTHFNVMAYADEPSVKTTLLEGSVMLNARNGQALLIPGQQADVTNSNGKVDLNYVNTDDAVSWKNGYFTFRNESVVSIMKKVSRWYDVDVEYRDDLSHVLFGGTISRAKDIQELLSKIELTNSVHFKIEGRRVIVKL